MESKQTSVAPTEAKSGTPSTYRLVIRIKLTPREPTPTYVRRRVNGGVLLVLGIAAVLLGWIGISMFKTDPISSPAMRAPSEAEPAIRSKPSPEPVVQQTTTPTKSTIKEVIPEVPRSARETIRGTIKVSVQVIVGQDGAVLAATAEDPGPSRYFERLAVEASKKWIFAPAGSQARRTTVVTFSFTRAGTTAQAKLSP